jgi:integrase
VSKIRQEAIERWYADRLERVKASTANKELARLKHCLARAVAWGYLRSSPAGRVARAKESPGRVRYLEPTERALLLDGGDVTVKASDGRSWVTRREPSSVLRLYMLAALQTGARRSELVRLHWPDVDMRQRTITFRETKNGTSRTVPMTDTLRAALAALPRPLRGDGPVFPEREPKVLSRMFARYVQTIGLPNLTFHDLRHDAASTLTMAGVSQRAVMERLGHRDPRMTIRYQHLAPGHLREAIQTLDQVATAPVTPAQAEAR